MKPILYFILMIFLMNYFNTRCNGRKVQIAGSKLSKAKKFPFFAFIDINDYSNSSKVSGRRRCGATLIHLEWVLTAAHCFPTDADLITQLEKTEACTVHAGIHRAFGVETYQNKLMAIYPHPKYVREGVFGGDLQVSLNDIAVAKLKKKYRQNKHVQTIALPPRYLFRRDEIHARCKHGTIIGKESVDILNTFSEYVQYAIVRSKERYEVSVKMLPSTTVFFSEVPGLEKDELVDDLGGPFVCYQPLSNGVVPYQYGVMSYTRLGVNKTTVISVYEDVQKHVDFIFDYVPKPKTHVSGTHVLESEANSSDMNEEPFRSGNQNKRSLSFSVSLFLVCQALNVE